jgi:hypothetical protein
MTSSGCGTGSGQSFRCERVQQGYDAAAAVDAGPASQSNVLGLGILPGQRVLQGASRWRSGRDGLQRPSAAIISLLALRRQGRDAYSSEPRWGNRPGAVSKQASRGRRKRPL